MIHPFTVLNLRGFIWYQGCSNTSNPQDYRVLQPLLIDNWRQAWNNPEAAFIITQLSAFERHDPENRLPDDYWREQQPHESGYSLLREVQDELRSYPNTGMAVTIDIGDHSDIHPSNKKDVAYRLAKQAERLCYGNTGIVEGPHYAAKTVEGDKIRISFTNVGEGLVARDGAVGEHSFAIAGADGNYVWAEAKIDGNTVVVWSPEVSEPVDVRYAWSMCPPNPNLYNAEGFPMCPFRTDAD
jgi:sialate O-acetylesterase